MQKVKGLHYNLADLYPNKKCLSSSQFLTYEDDPKQFYMEYVLGVRRKESKAMSFGKIFSAYFADRKFDWRTEMGNAGITNKRLYVLMEQSMSLMPVLPKKDCEYEVKPKYRGWTFRATLDGYVPDNQDNIENKTGQVEWTQERVNFSDQITFQNWCKWKRDGVQFRKNILNWVDTGARSTKLIRTFKTSRSIKALQQFEKRIDAVIDGIESKNFTRKIY